MYLNLTSNVGLLLRWAQWKHSFPFLCLALASEILRPTLILVFFLHNHLQVATTSCSAWLCFGYFKGKAMLQ